MDEYCSSLMTSKLTSLGQFCTKACIWAPWWLWGCRWSRSPQRPQRSRSRPSSSPSPQLHGWSLQQTSWQLASLVTVRWEHKLDRCCAVTDSEHASPNRTAGCCRTLCVKTWVTSHLFCLQHELRDFNVYLRRMSPVTEEVTQHWLKYIYLVLVLVYFIASS